MSDELRREIADLKGQMRSDFAWTAKAFGDMGRQFQEFTGRIVQQFQEFTAEVSERMNQVEGRRRLMEQRFARMMEAVDSQMGEHERDTGRQLADLRERVSRLEEERGPAA